MSFHDLSFIDIDGNKVSFDKFKGSVSVVINVASNWGYTKARYGQLVQLHKEKYPDVEIIAFPSLQFGAQEFDNHAEIKKFAETNFAFHKDGFNMMSLSDVNGDNTNEVYQWLKSKTNDKPIQWNFSTVFLVDPNGTSHVYPPIYILLI